MYCFKCSKNINFQKCGNCHFDVASDEILFIHSLSRERLLNVEQLILEGQKPLYVTNAKIDLAYDEWCKTVLFTGWLKNGTPIEIGKYIYDTGDQYEGTFYENGLPQHGKIIYTNGDSFEGEFSNGEISNGILWKHNGDVYSGTFLNEDISFGRVNYSNGYEYEGAFKNWVPQGKGAFDWNDGRRYTGDMFAGLPHGQGSLLDLNKNLIVTGEFFMGAPRGMYKIKIADNKKE